MNIKKFMASNKSRNIIIAIISLGVVLAIFQAGIFVGFHKASFLFKYGDNYYKTFGDRDDMTMFRDEVTGGHGVVGKIIKVSLPNFVVMGPDNIEKMVTTDASTTIVSFRNATTSSILSIDQFVTIIGSPNDQGQILARFIRVMPTTGRGMMGGNFTNMMSSTTNTEK